LLLFLVNKVELNFFLNIQTVNYFTKWV
jgi:hypothetical protein